MHKFPYLTDLKATGKTVTTLFSKSGHAERSKVYRITLLNDNHYKKILLK